MYTELLIGCGKARVKELSLDNHKEFCSLVTLDDNGYHNPNIIHDLTNHPLPFKDNSFNEIHAYDVLEHLAHQGDYEFFFSEWSEYYRILKPKGYFFATVPTKDSCWAWGDPSHKRIIVPENLIYLSQKEYKRQIGITKMSDFRYLYSADFEIAFSQVGGDLFSFVLQSQKKE